MVSWSSQIQRAVKSKVGKGIKETRHPKGSSSMMQRMPLALGRKSFGVFAESERERDCMAREGMHGEREGLHCEREGQRYDTK